MSTRSIVILAAGKGSRMKSQMAKVLHPICGESMLAHIIKASQKISDDIIVVVAHQKERVREQIATQFPDVTFVEQDSENYPGTGGALFNVKAKYSDVLILNGDMPLVSAEAITPFFEQDADIVMSIFDLENPDGYGRVVISDTGVERIVEQKDATPTECAIHHVNAGVYAMKREILEQYLPKLSNDNAQKEFYLTDIIALANADKKRIHPLLVDEEHFKGVNSKRDLAAAEEIMLNRIRDYWMTQGVAMQLPHTIYIESTVTFEGECTLENGVRLTGDTLIRASEIKAHSVIEQSIIKQSDIGPLAHIRPHSHIENTHIGNFVEVKKASLNGVKAGHLSYLGDATIDEGTNIGAGTITCNYDGKKKYQTTIGKNVFIGSDSQIVAPCIIEDDVIIAAGTTVADNRVKEGTLAISRTPLKQVEGFFKKFFATK